MSPHLLPFQPPLAVSLPLLRTPNAAMPMQNTFSPPIDINPPIRQPCPAAELRISLGSIAILIIWIDIWS